MKIKQKFTTIKIWVSTLKKLRLISAYSGKRMVAIIDMLVTKKLDEIEKEQKDE